MKSSLLRFLDVKLNDLIIPCVIASNSVLLIDGDDWLKQLASDCCAFRPDIGGCFDELGQNFVSAEINRLWTCNLKLIVYFGCQKEAVHEKNIWLRFYKYCEENARFNDDDCFPQPPLCKEQFLTILRDHSVQVVNCTVVNSSGIAAHEIAKCVCAGNSDCAIRKERYFAYGTDASYLAMPSCPFIRIGTINAEEQTDGLSGSALSAISAMVWRRREMCEALRVSADTLVDFFIAAGNDYTDTFPRSTAFDWTELPPGLSASITDGSDVQSLDALFNAVSYLTGRLRAAPDACIGGEVIGVGQAVIVQRMIDFSVALYDLQLQDECQVSGVDRSHLSWHEQLLNDKGCLHPERLEWWFRYTDDECSLSENDLGQTAQSFFGDIVAYVDTLIQKWRENPSRHLQSVDAHAVAYLRKKVAETGTQVMSYQHLLALEAMLRLVHPWRLRCATTTVPVISASFPHRPRWRDVVASHAYQRTCALLLQHLPPEAFLTEHSAPCDLYQGIYFHSLLRNPSFEAEQSAQNRAMPCADTEPLSAQELHFTSEFDVATESDADEPPPQPRVPPLQEVTFTSEFKEAAASDMDEPPSPPPLPPPPLRVKIPKHTYTAGDLPIYSFREEILSRIQRDRVTIIHGETGCGKSSCLPAFLLEHAESYSPSLPCQIIVSQPRRLAVTSLLQRVRPSLGDKVGMRMGRGVRDEFPETRIHYMTAGYLVRLMAHRPHYFHRVTHLVIDEVHERSADCDILCLLARDLLRVYPSLRVVLMSATIHVDLYRDYFSSEHDASFGDMECLSVGACCFPVAVLHADDIVDAQHSLLRDCTSQAKSQVVAACKELINLTNAAAFPSGGGGDGDEERTLLSGELPRAQHKAAVALVRALCVNGSAVLIFVSGLSDITELLQHFEHSSKFVVYPLHSGIVMEEQRLAFGAGPPDKVKVVLATNAAESLITIPDCDMVICLGTHKALQYSSVSHRTQLVKTWISKASATQRAGRTGRVRPGRVFRLYSRARFQAMSAHEVAEVHRQPLQDVMLRMWAMLEDSPEFEGVGSYLQRLVEPPDLRNVQQSYQYLFDSNLISHPGDRASLTSVGQLAGGLPIDIALGRMIAHGIILGVAAESVVMAAALSLPKTPFRLAVPMFHKPSEYIRIVRTKFLAAAEFDGGVYSEPIALLNLLRKWRTLEPRRQSAFCHLHGLIPAVMKLYDSTTNYLAQAVSNQLSHPGGGDSRIRNSIVNVTELPPPDGDCLNALRLILLWESSGNVLRLKAKAKACVQKASDASVLVHSNELTEDQVRSVLGPSVPFSMKVRGVRVYTGPLADWVAEDYFTSLVRMLDSLAQLSASVQADCISVLVESEDTGSSLMVFVVPEKLRVEEVLRLLQKDVITNKHRLYNSGRDLAVAFKQSAKCLNNAVILVVPEASRSEVNRLNNFNDALHARLSMVVPVAGDAKLSAANCCPSTDSVSNLFLGRNEGGICHIAQRMTGGGCVISFPAEDQPNQQSAPLGVAPLICDLPLGHRLLNCCRQKVSHSNGKLLVLESNHADRGEAIAFSDHSLDTTEHWEVKLDCMTPNWVNLRALETTGFGLSAKSRTKESTNGTRNSIDAILGKQSLLSCSLHCGPQSLFAICHSSLMLREQRDVMSCSGVSFLPPGAAWMHLALVCGGADATQLLKLCPDLRPELQGVTSVQTLCASQVAEMICTAHAVESRQDIAQLVHRVFSNICSGKEVAGSEASIGSLSMVSKSAPANPARKSVGRPRQQCKVSYKASARKFAGKTFSKTVRKERARRAREKKRTVAMNSARKAASIRKGQWGTMGGYFLTPISVEQTQRNTPQAKKITPNVVKPSAGIFSKLTKKKRKKALNMSKANCKSTGDPKVKQTVRPAANNAAASKAPNKASGKPAGKASSKAATQATGHSMTPTVSRTTDTAPAPSQPASKARANPLTGTQAPPQGTKSIRQASSKVVGQTAVGQCTSGAQEKDKRKQQKGSGASNQAPPPCSKSVGQAVVGQAVVGQAVVDEAAEHSTSGAHSKDKRKQRKGYGAVKK